MVNYGPKFVYAPREVLYIRNKNITKWAKPDQNSVNVETILSSGKQLDDENVTDSIPLINYFIKNQQTQDYINFN